MLQEVLAQQLLNVLRMPNMTGVHALNEPGLKLEHQLGLTGVTKP